MCAAGPSTAYPLRLESLASFHQCSRRTATAETLDLRRATGVGNDFMCCSKICKLDVGFENSNMMTGFKYDNVITGLEKRVCEALRFRVQLKDSTFGKMTAHQGASGIQLLGFVAIG